VKGAIDRAVEIGAEALQLFVQSPRTWRFPEHDPADLARFRERRAEAGLGGVLVHALYLLNLASPNDDFYEKSLVTLRATVETAAAIEADGVVFHVGSHQGAGLEAGLERVASAIAPALDACSERTWLLIENTAGAGGTIGRSVAELAAIVERAGQHERLGVCFDSCHLFASGCDVGDRDALDRLVDELDRSIGLDRLRALHVNDSKTPHGSTGGRHDNLLAGTIGERLGAFLGHPALQGLPAVLETPGREGRGPDAEELRKLRELHARWTAA